MVPISEAKRQIEGSKKYLEDLLGHNVPMFCYPKGRYNETIKKIVRNSGFIAARTCDPRDFNLPQDPYEWHITLFASNQSPLIHHQKALGLGHFHLPETENTSREVISLPLYPELSNE